mgnify:CR=1 FL=1
MAQLSAAANAGDEQASATLQQLQHDVRKLVESAAADWIWGEAALRHDHLSGLAAAPVLDPLRPDHHRLGRCRAAWIARHAIRCHAFG